MATNTRLVAQNVLGYLRSSTKMFHKGPTLFNAKPSEKLSKKLSSSVPILCTRNISDKPKPPSPMEEMKKSSRPYTIVVEGNIGSGKTTFLQPYKELDSISKNPLCNSVEVIDEPVDKWRNLQGTNLLHLMYEDPKRWSLMFQTYVQLTMMQHHTKISSKPIRIMERSLLSARYCFVENLYNGGNMTDAEYTVLSEWFNFLITCPQLNFKIDQIVYLRTDPEVAYERIKKRKRPEEHLIPFAYLQDLHELHEDWLVRKTKFQPLPAPVTVIDANPDLEMLSDKYRSLENHIFEQARAFK